MAVSKVSFSAHFWGSVVGYLVPLFLVSFFGQRLWDAMKDAPLWVWLAIGVLGGLGFSLPAVIVFIRASMEERGRASR